MSASDRAANRDFRGNNQDRARRRLWLLETFGDGETAPCKWCGKSVDYRSMEVDRYPVCGHDGGRYTRDNIVPSCGTCNGGRCSRCLAVRSPERPNWWSLVGRRGIGLRTGRKIADRKI